MHCDRQVEVPSLDREAKVAKLYLKWLRHHWCPISWLATGGTLRSQRTCRFSKRCRGTHKSRSVTSLLPHEKLKLQPTTLRWRWRAIRSRKKTKITHCTSNPILKSHSRRRWTNHLVSENSAQTKLWVWEEVSRIQRLRTGSFRI